MQNESRKYEKTTIQLEHNESLMTSLVALKKYIMKSIGTDRTYGICLVMASECKSFLEAKFGNSIHVELVTALHYFQEEKIPDELKEQIARQYQILLALHDANHVIRALKLHIKIQQYSKYIVNQISNEEIRELVKYWQQNVPLEKYAESLADVVFDYTRHALVKISNSKQNVSVYLDFAYNNGELIPVYTDLVSAAEHLVFLGSETSIKQTDTYYAQTYAEEDQK